MYIGVKFEVKKEIIKCILDLLGLLIVEQNAGLNRMYILCFSKITEEAIKMKRLLYQIPLFLLSSLFLVQVGDCFIFFYISPTSLVNPAS